MAFFPMSVRDRVRHFEQVKIEGLDTMTGRAKFVYIFNLHTYLCINNYVTTRVYANQNYKHCCSNHDI